MNHYCTLFDSNYLTVGMTMYQSIVDTGEDFLLYIVAFDDNAYKILRALNPPHTVIISLDEFEDDRLKAIKQTRSRGEYCWTCSCFSVLYCLNNFAVDEVTYIDSDLFFFQRPEVLLNEFHNRGGDVMISRHNYAPPIDQTGTSGVYCVQFMPFKKNSQGLEILNWWCDRCEEWCYARYEDGKFGDQKYLDDWPNRFDGVYVLENPGGGVAPWNVQQYRVTQGPFIDDWPVVFYHFSSFKWQDTDNGNLFYYSFYPVDGNVLRYIYLPYMEAIDNMKNYINERTSMPFH